ncbi:hypothetical protein BC830DRAFT_490895 [Chytriomyces sp. MP71]|nr:hypothetical protein BC830DRAFT_490895 [Chytriomyces sp. MP71]
MSVVCAGIFKHGFLDQLFSDITVQILGKDYNLHRLTLINNRYFAVHMLAIHGGSLSTGGKLEMTIEIDDPNISHDALRILFSRMYGNFTDKVTTENLKSVLATAYFFEDTDLCEMCADFIKVINFTPANALGYLNYASAFDYGEYTELLLRHSLIYFCRESFINSELAENVLPKMDFPWLARILQSDSLYVGSEFERFEFMENVLRKKLGEVDLSTLKETVAGMTHHVLALGRLPSRSTWTTPESESSSIAGGSSPIVPAAKVVFLGKLAAVTQPALPAPNSEGSATDVTDLAINLLAKGIVYAHMPRAQYDRVRADAVVPGFVFDRHFRIHHDLVRLVDTCPKGIQKLGVAYHYDRKNVLTRKDGEAETFWENVMGTVYAHDLLEMPPFRFSVEFGKTMATETVKAGSLSGVMKVLKGNVGESLVSRGVPYAGSLWSVRIEKIMEDGVSELSLSMVRKPSTKEYSTYSDHRPEAAFWCKLIAYCCVSEQVTEAYAFETMSVSPIAAPATILHGPNAALFKELYVCGALDPNAVSLRLAIVLGAL